MGLLDALTQSRVAAHKGEPSGWQTRVAGEIVLVSPDGDEFHALWRGSPRSMAKKLGVLKFPKIKGDVVQDMEVSSATYPITLYFEGDNNDLMAAAFFAACRQRGQWEVTHPIHGTLGLQLISVEEVDDPVESGNVTEFKTEWIESIDPLTLKTAREMKGIIDTRVADLNAAAADQFADNIKTDSVDLIGSIESAVESITAVSQRVLGPLFSAIDAVWVAENAIQNGIRDVFNATVLKVESLVGLTQELIELPVASNSSITDRKVKYQTLVSEFLTRLPGESNQTVRATASDDEKINAIAVAELSLLATIAALGGVISTSAVTPNGLGPDDVGGLATRAQAVKTASDLIDVYNDIVGALENAQTAFESKAIDKQYHGLLTTYSSASLLIYSAVEYLLNSTLNLAIERRFTLDRPRAPIEITISEYGGLGDNDSYYDLFIRSNDLHGRDIILLPRGREVVVYA